MKSFRMIGLVPALLAALMLLLTTSCYLGHHGRRSRSYQRSSPSHHDNRHKQKHGNRGNH